MRMCLITAIVCLSCGLAQAQKTLHGSRAMIPDFYSSGASLPAEAGVTRRGFARLFSLQAPETKYKGLKPQSSPTYDLRGLGIKMIEPEGFANDPSGDSEMPAGYTFLGQFIDHDLTLDTITRLTERANVSQIDNARTVDLDLDCVYGGGPERDPQLYNLPFLRVGEQVAENRYDLLRTPNGQGDAEQGGGGRALIGDPRNDENFIVSQMQAAFIAFHNEMVKALAHEQEMDVSTLADSEKLELYEAARDHTVHYYHRVIAEDFVPRLIGIERTVDLFSAGRDFYFPNGFVREDGSVEEPFIPVEFAVAAYRYGHSQVRQEYLIRAGVKNPLFRIEMVKGKSTALREIRNNSEIFGFRPIKSADLNLTVDWRLFFDFDGKKKPHHAFNFARVIDPELPQHLQQLQMVGVVGNDDLGSLAARNLNRGRIYRLPSGQSIAKAVLPALAKRRLTDGRSLLTLWRVGGKNTPKPNDLILEQDLTVRTELAGLETPLWYYILQESREFGARNFRQIPGVQRNNFEVMQMTSQTEDSEDLPTFYKLPRKFVDGAIQQAAEPTEARPVYKALDDMLQSEKNSNEYNAQISRWYGRARTGHTLGPIGGTIVGEVLLGLIDHYRDKTGKGLDFVPSIELETTAVVANNIAYGNRYLMSDFLCDAKVAEKPNISK